MIEHEHEVLFKRAHVGIGQNKELLVGGGIDILRNAFFRKRIANTKRLVNCLFGDFEIQIVFEKRGELNAQKPAFCQHGAVLFHSAAIIALQRWVRDDNRLAEKRTAFCATNGEHIGDMRDIGQGQAAFRCCQGIA